MDFTVQLPTDPAERRRLQNRLAQRKFRQKKQRAVENQDTPAGLPYDSYHPSWPTDRPISASDAVFSPNPPLPGNISLLNPSPRFEDVPLDLDAIDNLLYGATASASSRETPFLPPSFTSAHKSHTIFSAPSNAVHLGQTPSCPPILSPGPRSLPAPALPPATITGDTNDNRSNEDDGIIYQKDKGWLSSIHIAAQKGHERILRVLLQRGNIDPNGTDSDGRTPLFHAVVENHEPVVRLLLNHGAYIRFLDCEGRSVLHWAVLYRRLEVLQVLLEHWSENEQDHLDINTYDHVGWTPLHTAVERGFEAGVLLLIQYGADMNAKARKCPQTGKVIPFKIDDLITKG